MKFGLLADSLNFQAVVLNVAAIWQCHSTVNVEGDGASANLLMPVVDEARCTTTMLNTQNAKQIPWLPAQSKRRATPSSHALPKNILLHRHVPVPRHWPFPLHSFPLNLGHINGVDTLTLFIAQESDLPDPWLGWINLNRTCSHQALGSPQAHADRSIV